MRISDWSSDVCSSDLHPNAPAQQQAPHVQRAAPPTPTSLRTGPDVTVAEAAGRLVLAWQEASEHGNEAKTRIERADAEKIGRASGRERVCQDGWISGVAVPLKKTTRYNKYKQK